MADYSNETIPSPAPVADVDPETLRQQRRIVIVASIAGVLFIALIVAAVWYLLQAPAGRTETIRDIFIIFVALESLVIGVAMIILIIQIASLINLLQNEVRPILNATNETVNTLRGTTEFLSENMVEPVIKLNSYLAGLQRLFEMVGLKKR